MNDRWDIKTLTNAVVGHYFGKERAAAVCKALEKYAEITRYDVHDLWKMIIDNHYYFQDCEVLEVDFLLGNIAARNTREANNGI